VADEHSYWDWRDTVMKHPEGRAKGGEPCVKCGSPVPPNAHWKQRDRHVCSSRCNLNLNRQFNRLFRKAETGGGVAWQGAAIARPLTAPNPRVSGPRRFATLSTVEEGGVPYEWEGYCPLPGDEVERYGVVTRYQVLAANPDIPENHMFHGNLFVAVAPSGHMDVWGANHNGEVTRLHWGSVTPDGELFHGEFKWQGKSLRWSYEFISDVTPEGFDCRWEAPVAVPVGADHIVTQWSPAYRADSERKHRISSSAARHERRVRTNREGSERFDPFDVYERDGWICMLCGRQVDKHLRWPDEMSASLDHNIPLVAGGLHTRANCQLAHLICNIRKGGRTEVRSPAPGQDTDAGQGELT
jgi:5-methylcytosine-specific restriction endonuclease McrA